jgi:hypothetical protein
MAQVRPAARPPACKDSDRAPPAHSADPAPALCPSSLRPSSGCRADLLPGPVLEALRALASQLAGLPRLRLELGLDALPGAACAAPQPPEVEGGGSRARLSGAAGVCGVVGAVSGALGRVPGLAVLGWAGLLPLLAHLPPRRQAEALAQLAQVG